MKKIIICTFLFFLNVPFLSKSYGWGFKRNNCHEQPYIGSYEEEIEDTNTYYVGSSEEKIVYLTFDAGYDNGNLIKILDTLDEKNVTGTFFLTGDFLTRFSDLTKEIANRNHIVGNHTWNHKNITKLSNTELIEEVRSVEEKYYELTGKEMDKFFRPPAGNFNHESLVKIKNLGYSTIFWSVAYVDWKTNEQGNVEKSVNSVVNNLHNGAIILLHTVSSDNTEALPIIIDKIRQEGYEIKPLYNLLTNISI
ncbi:MAG: polysaccharide deacetylase family protein [Bacilli bacterium]|nr:polysaccharide deacetylase family protein [Bacilli bacterium]